ncbi:RNA-directed DNA polymerase, eukaryota [Tanacetum coccineum]
MEGFENFVNEVWLEAPVDNSNAMINMMNKLKYLKKKTRVWNGMRQSPKTRKHVLKQELADLEMIIDKGDASSDTLHKRAEVVKSIQEVDKLCAMEASQKAKIKWAIEGDENSKYYHGILNKKRNQLSIRGVLVEGDWVENPNMVKNEFLNHFKNRFDRPKSVRPMLNMEFPHHLNSMQQLDLEAEVSNEEIKKAVWDCGVDKSPGPDGFTFGFYKRFWSLIEKDVLAAVKYFFHYSRIPKGCNSSFIALIPKTPEAKMVKDFRPISLIGSLYKIIAKILANRLVVVLGDIVNEVQSAFVADRQILDGPFILNEVLQWCKLKKKHSFILKIDFEKAYDSVRWDYLDDVLRKFGFGEKWCGWIQECLRSSWGSVLVNGSPTEEFQFFKGLKQGDPLSPFIFILVMESLHISFKRVVDAGMFNGIVLNSVMRLSHIKSLSNGADHIIFGRILWHETCFRNKEDPEALCAGSEEDCRCGFNTIGGIRTLLFWCAIKVRHSMRKVRNDVCLPVLNIPERYSALRKGGMDSMPFPPGVGGRGAGEGNNSALSFEVITAEKAIDETNAGNYMLYNMGWQEGLDLQFNSHTIDAKMEMFEMVNDEDK